jgi:hypothetical protein
VITTDNGANVDFMNADGEITPQHYAFLVSESEFDEILGRIRERTLPYWADPAGGMSALGQKPDASVRRLFARQFHSLDVP